MGCFEWGMDRTDQPNESRKEVGAKKEPCDDSRWWYMVISLYIGLTAISLLSVYYGNPRGLINGIDSFGNTCGVDSNEMNPDFPLSGMNMTGKPYQFSFDSQELAHPISICVEECPQRDLLDIGELYSYYEERQVNFCQYDFNISLLLPPEGSKAESFFDLRAPCPTFPVYQSAPVLHRCKPTGKNAASPQVKKMYALTNSWEEAQQVFSDLINTWPTIVLSVGLAISFTGGFIVLLYAYGTIVSYFLCFCGVLVSIGLPFCLWREYYFTKNTLDIDQQLSFLGSNENTILLLAIIFTSIAIAMLLVISSLFKELPGMGELYKKTGNCLFRQPKLLLVVFDALCLLVIVLMCYVAIFILLGTTTLPDEKPPSPLGQLEENSTFNASSSFKTFKFVEHHGANVMRYGLMLINIIGLISMILFINHFQQLTIAGTVAPWYFDEPTLSVSTITKYHLGSVAKGSLIITICKIPRIIFLFFYNKYENGSTWGKCCFRCCTCGFWLLEKYIYRQNHNAYVIIALGTHGFHSAASMAFEFYGDYKLRVSFIGGTSGFVLFHGKLVVAALCGTISMLLERDNPALYNYMAPVIISSVFGFFIADIILSAYDMIADTLLVCSCPPFANGPGCGEQYNLAVLLRGGEPASISDTVSPPKVVETTV